jgi:predicted DCC family thiol-disulfide oxidoreductase YuxK
MRRPSQPTEPRAGWVLYDGDCGICSRWVTSWGPALQRRGLAIAPLQTPWVQERTGLPVADLVSSIRLLQPNGQLLAGPEVYRYILQRTWWGFPLYLLSRVPGFSQLFDWAYRTFARHRIRISASCGLPSASRADPSPYSGGTHE